VPSFDRLRYRRDDAAVFLYAFDLIELNGAQSYSPTGRTPTVSWTEQLRSGFGIMRGWRSVIVIPLPPVTCYLR
jgi:hypothetical protein